MSSGRIMVGPVDQPALLAPYILATEPDSVTLFDILDPGCKIDIVLDEERPAGCRSNDEPLMPPSLFVVGKYTRDDTFALDLDIPLTLIDGAFDRGIVYLPFRGGRAARNC